jgi:hypothetical protein
MMSDLDASHRHGLVSGMTKSVDKQHHVADLLQDVNALVNLPGKLELCCDIIPGCLEGLERLIRTRNHEALVTAVLSVRALNRAVIGVCEEEESTLTTARHEATKQSAGNHRTP